MEGGEELGIRGGFFLVGLKLIWWIGGFLFDVIMFVKIYR